MRPGERASGTARSPFAEVVEVVVTAFAVAAVAGGAILAALVRALS